MTKPGYHTGKDKSSETGMAYAAILVLLAILSTLAFTFIFKVGIQTAATMTRGSGMQAHYLAESAANHAMWSILNDPTFAPAADTYTMHSLGNGRYGYKVRMPTETTFATVATVGAIEDSVVNQSYVQYIIPSNVFTAYGSSTNALPLYRRLIGAVWTDPGDMLVGGAEAVYWLELEGCPIRKELVGGIIDAVNEIKVAVYDGTTWGNAEPFGHADKNYKCFDIAYESQSGNALVVNRDGAGIAVYYNIWDGTSWAFANPQNAFNLAGGALRLVTMASCPGNNQILIATVNSLFDLQLFLWNGSVFTDLGVIETSTYSDQPGTVQIVYERQSGDALVIWTIWGTTPKFLVWNGTTLGTEDIAPIFPSNVYFLRAAGDPTSDHIVVAGVDKFYDVQVGIWDGTAWTDSREVETDNANQVRQGVDVAWEATGEDALVVWVPWSAGSPIVRSLAWRKGTALADSTVEPGPDLQSQPWLVRLLPISQSEKIILLAETNTNELRYSLWDGDRLKGDPGILLESNISVTNQLAFDLAEANVPRTGGTGSGIVTNQPPTVDAGLDQTIYLPNDATLDGTVTDDSLPNPPATVDTTWSKISGPGTVIFGDPSVVDTTATFSEAGTYVLRLTANDNELMAYDEVTITVSALCVGLAGYWELDETSGTNASDSSGNSNNGTLINMDPATDWIPGHIEGGIDLDGVDDHVLVPNNANLSMNSEITISAWISNDTLSAYDPAVAKGVGNTYNYWFGTHVDEICFAFASSGTWWEKETTGANLQTDTWYHIAVTYDNTQNDLIMYLNGGEVFNGSLTGNMGATVNTDPLYLGRIESGADIFDGTLDEVRIYNRVLSPSEIAQLHALTEGGCGVVAACNADYVPTVKVDYFSTTAYGSGALEGLAYIPFGESFYGQAAPADGALISVDMGSDMFYFTDLAGNLITSLTTGSGTHTGVTLVQTGTWANHLAVSDKFSDEIKYFDLSGSFISSFSTNVSADFDSATPEDVAFIGNTESGTYNNHLAIPDPGRQKVFLVDQNGVWVSSIDISAIVTQVMGAVHIPETDKLLLVNSSGEAFIVDFTGNLWNQYNTTSFGTSSAKAITINTLTCDHLVGDPSNDLVVMLNLGGGGDTDPPTPDPMTWASPPTAVGAFSITMTATTASDPSGVKYYFECTAGGGNDSGWLDSPTYIDSGLSPNTQYTYRVKASDKAATPNETGWSTEASATTSSNEIYVYDITMGYGTAPGGRYFGRATVWIKSTSGQNISGATVSGDWSGAVSESSMGSTGSDGKVTLESGNKKNGGTFTFTVTSVVKTGYTYNSSLNVEDSDTITAP